MIILLTILKIIGLILLCLAGLVLLLLLIILFVPIRYRGYGNKPENGADYHAEVSVSWLFKTFYGHAEISRGNGLTYGAKVLFRTIAGSTPAEGHRKHRKKAS